MRIVNVACVPQRSPFRYPGGKTWLVPHIRAWLKSRQPRPQRLIEPFAGGAIVGLTAVFEDLAQHVTLVEKDADVAAVWRTVLHPRHGRWLADRVLNFELTPENVRRELTAAVGKLSVRERAFKTLLRNRVQRGGILAPGAGLMKLGENGRGLASRWYPHTLHRRIEAIMALRHRLSFVHGDGLRVIEENRHNPEVVFFVDPPYTVAGRRLYTYSDVDHQELFRLMSQVAGDFLMTYDDAGEIRDLARRHGFQMHLVPMKSTHHAEMTELLIGRDLGWVQWSFHGL